MRRADSFERPWCWERLRAGGEGDDRGWDGWMVSPTQWTWVWVNSGTLWWTGRSIVLRFMGSQSRTLLSNWTELKSSNRKKLSPHFFSILNDVLKNNKWYIYIYYVEFMKFYPRKATDYHIQWSWNLIMWITHLLLARRNLKKKRERKTKFFLLKSATIPGLMGNLHIRPHS